MFFAGDFNGKSHLWWPDGDETPVGRELDDMFTSLGLSQVFLFQPILILAKNPHVLTLS